MRLPGEPEQYLCEIHSYAPDAGTKRERWMYQMPANRLCAADIGQMLAIESPSARMVKLLAIHRVERTVFGMLDDKPVRLLVLCTDDGDWEMRGDRLVWLNLDPAVPRGSTIRWPVGETGDGEPWEWTTEKPS